MKISTRGRYAVRMMIDLAMNQSATPVSLKEIAKRQEISVKYMEQIMSVFAKAGLVRSIRGSGGGYQLTKKPEDYTVGMILRLTEGSLAPVPCAVEQENQCERIGNCVTVKIWKKINDAVCEVVDGITLQDLMQWQQNIEGEDESVDLFG